MDREHVRVVRDWRYTRRTIRRTLCATIRFHRCVSLVLANGYSAECINKKALNSTQCSTPFWTDRFIISWTAIPASLLHTSLASRILDDLARVFSSPVIAHPWQNNLDLKLTSLQFQKWDTHWLFNGFPRFFRLLLQDCCCARIIVLHISIYTSRSFT